MTFVDVSNLFMFDVKDLLPALQINRGLEGINSEAGSIEIGDAPSSGIFLSDGRIFTSKHLRPKFGALSYDEKRKLGDTRNGESGLNAKSNQKDTNMKRQSTEKDKTLKKKFKSLQRKFASLEAGNYATEKGVPEKYIATDYPPVGAGKQMGGRSSRAVRN